MRIDRYANPDKVNTFVRVLFFEMLFYFFRKMYCSKIDF